MKNEIVQQKTHRGGYEQQMLLVGAKTIWVETGKSWIGPSTRAPR